MTQQYYEIIKDEEILKNFIEWLPDLEPHETFYVALFARRKYLSDPSLLKTDKTHCKRFTSSRSGLFNKIRQLECPVGSYVIKGIAAPQEALALYITPNPRNQIVAARTGLIRLSHLITQPYTNYNVHQEMMTAIHTSVSRKVWLDFDFDHVDLASTITEVYKAVNKDAVTVLTTRGGFHVLVRVKDIKEEFARTWYNGITRIPGVDVRGDNLLPIPGCSQGGFSPYFVR